ncbi:flagellar hook-associated protein FlgL [Gallaecimonas mangrovi]|uniref:flagellar hook-associated protein FlgL n=1 Tax=Gallaecimonas mangrovi TaxID=2291597 RepID=UPI000E207060|nr:flagellar hook-associated protein FlgL [Gallaecimonas mangrovi]
MRVSSNQLSQFIVQGMGRQDQRYAKSMQQMSTGYKLTQASDNPLTAVQLIGMGREQTSLKQFRDNIGNVSNVLRKSEVQLDSSFDVLLRIQDLALGATNGASSDGDRHADASELKNLRDNLLDFANARDEEGYYLFSGSKLSKAPLVRDKDGHIVYQGDDQQRLVQVARGVMLSTNVTIDNVYFGQGLDFFHQLDDFIKTIETPGSDVPGEGKKMLKTISGTIGTLNRTLTELGGRIRSVESLSNAQDDMSLSNEKVIGQLRDLDYVSAAEKVNRIQMALNTTQKTYSKLSQLSLFDYL